MNSLALGSGRSERREGDCFLEEIVFFYSSSKKSKKLRNPTIRISLNFSLMLAIKGTGGTYKILQSEFTSGCKPLPRRVPGIQIHLADPIQRKCCAADSFSLFISARFRPSIILLVKKKFIKNKT